MIRISSYALAAALLTPGPASAALTCQDAPGGVMSSFKGECTPDKFKENLHSSCDLTVLFPAVSHDEGIAEFCEYAKTQFVEIQGTYQLDRRYFAGGGPLVDGESWKMDLARLARFEANLGSGTVIEFPEYEARRQYNINNGLGADGYPANMNLEASCDLNTIMCCFTDDGTDNGSKGFAANGDATTDVCRHDLHDSPQSNHIYEGWSVFPVAETPTHCVGFTWDSDDDELLGNMMYDVSLRNSVRKGYTEGVPSAPMCGCVEHMPVVEEAACRTATKNGDATYTFTYVQASEDMGYVTGTNTASITYSGCGDLATEAAKKGNDLSEHLVGAGGCADDIVEYLNEEQFLHEGSHPTKYVEPDDQWSDLFVGEGIYFQPPDLDPLQVDADFRALIEAGCKATDGSDRKCIVRRVCSSCPSDSHKDIYYQRITDLPGDEVYFLNVFMNNWIQQNNDMDAGDFALYSSYEDALAGTNAWNVCNYGTEGRYGFPRNCGPDTWYNEWNSYVVHGGYAEHHAFYVEKP